MDNFDINVVIGQNLQKLRREKKLTQLELAEKFNYSDKSISKWEKGESLPSIEVLYQLSKFYGVSLDALTSEAMPTPQPEHHSLLKDKLLPTKLIIALLSVCTVWIAATIIYTTLLITLNIKAYTLFLWSIPISCILFVIFNAIWGKRQWLFWILSIFLWSLLVCLHMELIQYNVWPIYFIGIPIQTAIILWSTLLVKTKRIKEQKLKQEEQSQAENTEN